MIASSLLLAFLLPAAAPSLDIDLRIDFGSSRTALTELAITEHFEIHARPRSRAAAELDRTAALVELEYAEIVHELGLKGRVDESEPFYLFLYDDIASMDEITGAPGSGGFSAGRETHMPWDNDQTRKHELVHIVAAACPETGSEARNMFFAEGIANAVLEYVHGVPVHAVAAYERERGTLPALPELVEHPDFYAFLGEHPGLNGYDVGGSFFLYLLETFPPQKVMDYVKGKPIEKALGRKLPRIEKGWHERLDAFPMRPALRILLSQRRSDGGEFAKYAPPPRPVSPTPADVLGQPAEWKMLHASLAAADEITAWKIGDESAFADNPDGAEWSHADVPGDRAGDFVLRVKVKTGASCYGIKLHHGQTQALVLGMGSFIYIDVGGIAFDEKVRLKPNTEHDLVLALRGGHATFYLDGHFLLEADVPRDEAPIGIGVVGGSATFREFAIREW